VSIIPGLKVNVVSHFNRPQNQGIASRFTADSAWSEDWKRNGTETPPRGYVFAALKLPDGRFLLTYALHLKSNFDGIAPNIPKREEAARQLLAHVDSMVKLYGKRGPLAVIIGGDFNTSPDPEFQGEKTFEIIKGAGMDWTFEGLPFAERISHPGSGKYADADFDHIFTAGLGKKRHRLPPLLGCATTNPSCWIFRRRILRRWRSRLCLNGRPGIGTHRATRKRFSNGKA
jgi:endonuclease/exonuclease/phosphatase family metal-dependent hydrolase